MHGKLYQSQRHDHGGHLLPRMPVPRRCGWLNYSDCRLSDPDGLALNGKNVECHVSLHSCSGVGPETRRSCNADALNALTRTAKGSKRPSTFMSFRACQSMPTVAAARPMGYHSRKNWVHSRLENPQLQVQLILRREKKKGEKKPFEDQSCSSSRRTASPWEQPY